MNAGSVKEVSEANNALTGALTSLFAIAENYPGMFNFKEADFFEIASGEREAPKVQF